MDRGLWPRCTRPKPPLAPSDQPRPQVKTLYDVFSNIRDDEAEHVNTMQACQVGGGVGRRFPGARGCLGGWMRARRRKPPQALP